MKEKIEYIKNFPGKLSVLNPSTNGKWGKMNAQQMVEHLTNSMRVATGKEFQKIELLPEQTQKVRTFFLSDKPFRENTSNHLLPEIPPPCRNTTMQKAISELENELDEFFLLFEKNSVHTTINPFAGEFNFGEWMQLLHKHFLHHAKQFGLAE